MSRLLSALLLMGLLLTACAPATANRSTTDAQGRPVVQIFKAPT